MCCKGFRDLRKTARTSYNNVPNVACYQLHYTRIFACHDYSTKIVRFKVFSCLWSFMWSKRFLPQAIDAAIRITASECSAPLHFTDLKGKVKVFLAECESTCLRTLPLQTDPEPCNHLPSMARLRYSADSARASASFW